MKLHKCNCKFVPPAVLENLAKEGIEPARAFKIPIPTMAKARGCCIGSAIIVAVALVCQGAVAHTAPAGWRVDASAQSWKAISPEQGGGPRVRLNGKANGAYQASGDHLADAWKARTSYAPGAAPPPALPEKACRREPIWGLRISLLCRPSGVCPGRVLKGYKTVCE